MDQDWSITRITRERKERAWKQLGTSGSGNHFVEFGILELETRDDGIGLDAGRCGALSTTVAAAARVPPSVPPTAR